MNKIHHSDYERSIDIYNSNAEEDVIVGHLNVQVCLDRSLSEEARWAYLCFVLILWSGLELEKVVTCVVSDYKDVGRTPGQSNVGGGSMAPFK